jgi:hypothetical protein
MPGLIFSLEKGYRSLSWLGYTIVRLIKKDDYLDEKSNDRIRVGNISDQFALGRNTIHGAGVRGMEVRADAGRAHYYGSYYAANNRHEKERSMIS